MHPGEPSGTRPDLTGLRLHCRPSPQLQAMSQHEAAGSSCDPTDAYQEKWVTDHPAVRAASGARSARSQPRVFLEWPMASAGLVVGRGSRVGVRSVVAAM
jgi:hypothetical protein